MLTADFTDALPGPTTILLVVAGVAVVVSAAVGLVAWGLVVMDDWLRAHRGRAAAGGAAERAPDHRRLDHRRLAEREPADSRPAGQRRHSPPTGPTDPPTDWARFDRQRREWAERGGVDLSGDAATADRSR